MFVACFLFIIIHSFCKPFIASLCYCSVADAVAEHDEFQTFWKNIVEHVVEDTVVDGNRFETVHGNVAWLDTCKKLYVRDCYTKLKDKLISDKVKSALILGTPGIGKPLFMRWLIVAITREHIGNGKSVSFRV